MNRFKLSFLVVFVIISVVSAYAQTEKEHPLIRPFPGSKLMPKGEYSDFSEYTFRIADTKTKKTVKKTVKGKFWRLYEIMATNAKG